MVFQTSLGRARRWRQVRHAALILLSLTAAHEAIYLLRFGSAGLLPETGGHAYWPLMIAGAVVAVALLIGWSWWRLTFGVKAAAGNSSRVAPEPAGFLGEGWSIFGRLAPQVAAAYVVLENAEHFFGHGHFEGLDVYLSPTTALALPLLLLVVAAVSGLGALVRWREVVLAARLRARRAHTTRRHRSRAPFTSRWIVTAALVRVRLLLASSDLGRAPPVTSAV